MKHIKMMAIKSFSNVLPMNTVMSIMRLQGIMTARWSVLLFFLALVLGTVGCKMEEDVVLLNPDAGPSFLDVENDGYSVRLNARPVRDGQSGVWRIYIGENGRFDDVNDPKTIFYGEPGESYQLGWEVSEKNQYKASTITVSFKALDPQILTQVIDTVYNNVSLGLEAIAPKFGAAGKWEIISGDEGRIVNEGDHEAYFIGKEYRTYTLSWTLSYGSKEESRTLQFTTDRLRAQAGFDQLDIITNKEDSLKYYTLDAILPPGATGFWRIVNNSTGRVFDLQNPNSLLQGVPDSLYSLTWQVNIDEYTSIDTVDLRFRGKWGIWEDFRDEQRYRFTEINGLEWMADNYNYAIDPGANSWYYGHGYRSITRDGYPLESDEDRKKYGRIYSYYIASEFAPEGWRLPTAEEVNSLVNSLGGVLYAKDKLVVGGETGLDLNYPGYYELSSSSDPAFRNVFVGQEMTGLFFTQNYNPNNGYGVAFNLSSNGGEVNTVIAPFNFYMLSVRYVREVQK